MKSEWIYRRLDDVCSIDYGTRVVQKKDRGSKYYVYGGGGATFMVDSYNREDCFIVARFAMSPKCTRYVKGKFFLNDSGLSVSTKTDGLLQAFVNKVLLANNDTIYSFGKGMAQKNLDMPSFRAMMIPIPSLDEQERIVAELDLLSGIIDKQKSLLKELDTLAQSIFYDMFGNPDENPKGWDVRQMGELFDIGSSKRVFESEWTEEGVPFYRAREIVRLSKNEPIESPIFISEELYADYSKKYGVPTEGDIMITAVGTLGVSYIVKKTDRFYFKDGNILWFKNKGLCETRFIKDEYATDYVKQQIQGNANAAVVGTYTIMNANKTKVIVPPLALQKDYVERVKAIDNQKDTINRSIVESQKLFDYTMDKYFG